MPGEWGKLEKQDSQSGAFKIKCRTALKYNTAVVTTQLSCLVFYHIMNTLELFKALMYATFYTSCQQHGQGYQKQMQKIYT